MKQLQNSTRIQTSLPSVPVVLQYLSKGKGAFIVYVLLVTCFWWPSLWDGQLIIHGDAAHLGLSLLAFLAEGLADHRSLLWDSGIYGGHPLFAESQGGFANPANLLCALLFEPEYGIGVLHWLNMLIAGGGVYCLCRMLRFGPWPATFASIAVGFSSTWLSFQYNISVTGTLSWLPWLFAAMENWLNKPTLKRASLMSMPAALMIFGGYPPITHGAFIYIFCYCLALFLKAEGRMLLHQNARKLLTGGIAAILLAIGLSAIQLLPLAELVTQSHRKNDIGMLFPGIIPTIGYLRGVLFFSWGNLPTISFGSLGSMSVCLLAGLCLFYKLPARLLAHAIASLLLLNIGMEYASPIFRVIYEHQLIPGLHGYRIMHIFFPVAVLGLATLAAFVLDNLTKHPIKTNKLSIYLTLFFVISFAAYNAALPLTNFVAPILIVAILLGLTAAHALRYAPLLITLAITVDAAMFRNDIFNFYKPSALTQPLAVKKILEDPEISQYRASDSTISSGMVFIPSNDANLAGAYQRYLDSLSPFPSLRAGIPSINGVLGLTLARRMFIDAELQSEIRSEAATPPGRRLIDILGIKYVSTDDPKNTVGFELLDQNLKNGVFIYKNKLAQTKLRTYQHSLPVGSLQEALQLIRAGKGDQLLVEGYSADSQSCDAPPPTLTLRRIEATRYLVDVESKCPTWLFVGDASYPGWSAQINGHEAELYPAQILGKAVHLPSGDSQVDIRYTPVSFYWGMLISLISATALAVISMRRNNA